MFKVYEDDTCLVHLETFDTLTIIHWQSYKWSKAVYDHYLLIIQEIKNILSSFGITELYAHMEDSDIKLQKFSAMMGFTPTESFVMVKGDVDRRMWICHF